MKGATLCRSACAVLLVLAASTGRAWAQESDPTPVPANHVTNKDRMWANFAREAAVVGANTLWIELRGIKLQDDSGPKQRSVTGTGNFEGPTLGLNGYPLRDYERKVGKDVEIIDGGRFDLLAAYGIGDSVEVGADLPFVMQEQIDFADGTFVEHASLGDLQLWGKYKMAFTDELAGAGGVELSVPTGSQANLFGSGTVGFNPFVATRYQSGRFAVGGHVGVLLNVTNRPQVFNWSLQGVVRGSALFALRTEINGRLFNEDTETFNDIAVYPGIDFNLTDRFIIRPEGLAHITDDAIDWGIGIGLVYTLAL